MQILDDGRIVYDVDEIPKEILFKDLSYQIISSKDSKKLLPILRYALSKEVKFLLGNCLIDMLTGNDITYFIDDGLQLLIDAVSLKFMKHVKENAKNGDPRKADVMDYWNKVFSVDDPCKKYYYQAEYDPEDNDFDNKFLAASFLTEVVEPSTKYLLDKYCDKQYEIVVSEVTDNVYNITNIQSDDMTDDEIIKHIESLSEKEYDIVRKTIIQRTFKGYTKRNKNNEVTDTTSEE